MARVLPSAPTRYRGSSMAPQIPAFPLTPLPLYLSKREIIVYNEAGHINVAISELYTNILQQKIPRSGARTC